MENLLNLFVFVLRKHCVASWKPASWPKLETVLLEEEKEYGAVLLVLLLVLLVDCLVVEDLVDLSTSDMFDIGEVVPLIPSSLAGVVIFRRLIRTSLEPCLVFPSVGRLVCVLQFLLSRLAV